MPESGHELNKKDNKEHNLWKSVQPCLICMFFLQANQCLAYFKNDVHANLLTKSASMTVSMTNPTDGTSMPLPAMVTSEVLWRCWIGQSLASLGKSRKQKRQNNHDFNKSHLGCFAQHSHIHTFCGSCICKRLHDRESHHPQHFITTKRPAMFLAPPDFSTLDKQLEKSPLIFYTLCGAQKNPSCCAFKVMTMNILTKGQAEAQQSASCCKCWQTSIKSAATPSLDCRAGILWQILRLKNQAHYHLLQQQHETSWQKKAQIKIESMQWNPPIVPNQSVGKIFLIDPLVLECRVGKVHDKVLRSPHRVDLSWSIKFAEIQNGPLTQLCLQMHYEINQSKVILKNVSMCQFWRPHPKHHISIHLEFGKWAHQLQDLPQARALPSVLLFVPVKPILAQPRDFGQQIFWLFTFFNLYMILWM